MNEDKARKPPRPPTPTPEEIAEECRKIREGWSDERWKREDTLPGWELPRVEDPRP